MEGLPGVFIVGQLISIVMVGIMALGYLAVVIAIWRMMKAQESIAKTLRYIARNFQSVSEQGKQEH